MVPLVCGLALLVFPYFLHVSLGATQAAGKLAAGAELKPDGYRIREEDGNWYFAGGRRRGPVNAVLAFMEEDLDWRDYSMVPEAEWQRLAPPP